MFINLKCFVDNKIYNIYLTQYKSEQRAVIMIF